jgi:hypothetical protein
MPEPNDKAGQGTQTVEPASTPAPKEQDKPTTIAEQKAVPPAKGLMDFLDIPPEVQERIAAKAQGEKPSSDNTPPDPNKPEPPAEKPADKPAEQHEAEEEEEEDEEEEEREPEEEVKPAAQGEKPDKRQKRINRLTRKLHTTETQLDTALRNLEELQGRVKEREQTEESVPIGTGPLSYITTERQLNQELAKAEPTIEFCDANPDGVTIQENGEDKFIAPETILQWKRKAERVVRNAPTRRLELRDFTAERNHFDGLAGQLWPELFDKSTETYQTAQNILELFPAVKTSSRANYALGLVIEGARALEAKAAKHSGNGAPKKQHRDISERAFEPRVPLAPEAPEPPSREAVPSSHKKLNEAMSNLVKDSDGSADSVAAVFAAREEFSRKQPHSRTPVKV